jgi:Xaa-Pro aminopeptidase
MFKSKVYIKRRKELKKKCKSGILLFIGNDESHVGVRDTVHKFRQNANFLFYWGFSKPGLAALIDIDKSIEILFGHDLTTEEIIWEGKQKKLVEKAKLIGASQTAEMVSLKKVLLNYRKGRRQIHFLPQHNNDSINKISFLLNKSVEQIKLDYSVEFTKAVIEQRSIKTKKEVAEIEKALKITFYTQTTAMKKTKPGKYEFQIVKNMEKILLTKDTRWAYLPIFTVNGERLHNHHYCNKMKKGQLVINDSGAESKTSFYSSDITRTFPVSGKFTKKQKQIYEIVLKSQLEAIKVIKPGVKYLEIHQLTTKVIAEGLHKLGLMKADIAKGIEAGAHALFFPHGLGHMMGLDVHDMEDLGEDLIGYDDKTKRSKQFGTAYLRFGKELQQGHVITVEPGIYFIPQLINQWEKEKKFTEYINYEKAKEYIGFGGIRIEDNILVTKTGNRVLGKPIPKTVSEIEAIMKN